jgi:23S rRNA (uracil1939-C5)-methyltransferase
MRSAKPHPARAKSAEQVLVQIEKPVYGGSFLARIEGKAVFVPLTLPGEQVRIRMVDEKRGYATAEVEEIVAPAPQRIAPECLHFGACGGCHYQHTDYATQLELKQTILRETLERGGVRAPEEISVLSAEQWGYRNRIRLAFDAAGNVGYRSRRSHAIIPIQKCPIATPLLVRAGLAAVQTIRKAAPEFSPTEVTLFCNADETALLASFFCTGPTKTRFDVFAKALAEGVPELKGAELAIEDRNDKAPRTISRWGENSLLYSAGGFDYRVHQGAFFQVNRWLVEPLLERVAAGRSGAVAWDLFAGVGLFARRLTASFPRVVAVESAPTATGALEENLKVRNGTAVKSDTLSFLRGAASDHRPNNDQPDLIVVDPPRTGLGVETTALLARIGASALTYVSCDPATLARDLKALIASGYAVESMTLADLFPQTFHLETVAHLRRS